MARIVRPLGGRPPARRWRPGTHRASQRNAGRSSASPLVESTDRISRQRDHLDGGALVYEQVPLLGALVRFVKRRV
jgi:hypothetical protein